VLIQQPVQSAVGIIQDIPKQLLADLAIGQSLQAIVTKPALAAELVQIRLANSLLNIRTPQPLESGQIIKLEVVIENGKPALQFVAAEPTVKPNDIVAKVNASLVNSIKVGQQLSVEVVKVLAENKLLVQANISQTKQQIEVDISQVAKHYKVGDKAALEVVTLKPFQVYIQPEKTTNRQQLIANSIQELVKQQVAKPNLNQVIALADNKQMPEQLKSQVQALLNNTLDKSALTQVQAFKQAILNSGVFTEKQLLSEPAAVKTDFKANIVKLMAVIKTVIEQGNLANNNEVRTLLNKLPAQVQSALASSGRTPQQLLNVLVSSVSRQPSDIPLSPVLTPVITDQKQAALLAQLLTKNLNKQLETTIAHLQTLLKDVEGVHNKIQLNQLAMLKEPDTTSTTQASWLFDVPIKDKQNLDLLQLQIDKDQNQGHSQALDDEIWNVQLRLDTQNLGPLQATLTLQQHDLKVVLRAQRPESAALLEANIDLLQQALNKLDISVSHLSCSCGEVAQRSLTEIAVQSSSLLDVSV